MKKCQSEKEISIEGKKIDEKKKKKKKKKGKETSTIDELVLGRNVSPSIERMNQSYSEVDYLPMMATFNQQKAFSTSVGSFFLPERFVSH